MKLWRGIEGLGVLFILFDFFFEKSFPELFSSFLSSAAAPYKYPPHPLSRGPTFPPSEERRATSE